MQSGAGSFVLPQNAAGQSVDSSPPFIGVPVRAGYSTGGVRVSPASRPVASPAFPPGRATPLGTPAAAGRPQGSPVLQGARMTPMGTPAQRPQGSPATRFSQSPVVRYRIGSVNVYQPNRGDELIIKGGGNAGTWADWDDEYDLPPAAASPMLGPSAVPVNFGATMPVVHGLPSMASSLGGPFGAGARSFGFGQTTAAAPSLFLQHAVEGAEQAQAWESSARLALSGKGGSRAAAPVAEPAKNFAAVPGNEFGGAVPPVDGEIMGEATVIWVDESSFKGKGVEVKQSMEVSLGSRVKVKCYKSAENCMRTLEKRSRTGGSAAPRPCVALVSKANSNIVPYLDDRRDFPVNAVVLLTGASLAHDKKGSKPSQMSYNIVAGTAASYEEALAIVKSLLARMVAVRS